MRTDEQKRLIDSVLSDWPASRRKSVQVEFGNRWVRVFLHDPVCGFVSGMSRCHPFDLYNDVSGLVYALARLRVRFAYKEYHRSLKTWVPKEGETYYVPGLGYNSLDEGDPSFIHSVCSRVWHGNADDYMYLAAGLVFRTPFLAKKRSRALFLEGHRLSNLVKRHLACKKYMVDMDYPDVDYIPDLDELVTDWSDFGLMRKGTGGPVSCPCEAEPGISCKCEDDHELDLLGGEEGPNPVGDGFWENEESIVGPVLKSGQRYFMDPVTGEMFISESGVSTTHD